MAEFKPFISILRSLGAEKEYETRSLINGRLVIFNLAIDDRRTVVVQLFEGEELTCVGRASHNFKGCCDTRPSYFESPFGMIRAIIFEAERKDGKYRLPGSLPSEKSAMTPPQTQGGAG